MYYPRSEQQRDSWKADGLPSSRNGSLWGRDPDKSMHTAITQPNVQPIVKLECNKHAMGLLKTIETHEPECKSREGNASKGYQNQNVDVECGV